MIKVEEYKFSEIMLGFFDGPHATPTPSDSGPVFLGIKNINEKGGLNLSEIRHISESEFTKWTKRVQPRENDLVFSYEATLHRYALIPDRFRGCLGRRMALIRVNPQLVDVKYLYLYFLSTYWRAFIETVKVLGATVDRISIIDFPNYKINLPNLPTQKKIATILSAYDDLIENNNQRIKLLEEMGEEIYKEWFVRMRFPGYQDSLFFDKEGKEVPQGTVGALPEGWKVKEINDFVDIISGFAFKTEIFEEEGQYRLVTIKNVQNGFFVTETTDCIKELPRNLKDEIFIKDKDILLSLTGNIGRICLAYGENYLLNQRVAKLKPRKEYLFEYVYMFFRSDFLRKTLENYSNGAAQQNLSPVDMGLLQFALPSEELLMKYSQITAAFFEEHIVLSKKNQVLQETRDLLLPRLISGKLSVEDIDLEDMSHLDLAAEEQGEYK